MSGMVRSKREGCTKVETEKERFCRLLFGCLSLRIAEKKAILQHYDRLTAFQIGELIIEFEHERKEQLARNAGDRLREKGYEQERERHIRACRKLLL